MPNTVSISHGGMVPAKKPYPAARATMEPAIKLAYRNSDFRE